MRYCKISQYVIFFYKKGVLILKKIVIAGCRDYENYNEAKEYIDFLVQNIRKTHKIVIISGGCKGADALGERYAKENGFEIERHPARWQEFGKSAGPRRNLEMAEQADYVICFWDGKSRGTKTMIEFSKKLEKPLRIKKIKNF